MALTHSPIIGRTYRVTAPEYIPCFPKLGEVPETEIPRGQVLKFVSQYDAGFWEVEFYDPNNPGTGIKKGLVCDWVTEWLLPIFQRR